MINLYDSIYDTDGNIDEKRTKLFIKETDADGNILRFGAGIGFIPTEPGTLLITDVSVPLNIDNYVFINGALHVKNESEAAVDGSTG